MKNIYYKLLNKFFFDNKNQDIKKILLAKNLITNLKKINQLDSINDCEFKAFSQFGDDGIIQYLINKIEITNDFENFIEFGVENYNESNTKFLLLNNNWNGLIFDGSTHNIKIIKNSYYYWKHAIEAHQHFVDKENINEFIKKNNSSKNIGILSIDIDGNDYWIWDSIYAVDPIIVIIEYNSLFGEKYSLTVPYDKNFVRENKHYSNKYYGASIKALKQLGNKKGYDFLFTNSARNNAYFIKRKYKDKIKLKENFQEFEYAKFRESRDESGKLNYLARNEILKQIKNMPILDLEENKIKNISEVFSSEI